MPIELTAAGRAVLEDVARHQQVIQPFEGKRLKFLSAGEFLAQDFRRSFLVEGILTDMEPAVIGGARKTLKTSISMDLAISLASGKPFLGKFRVPQAVPVGVISGESGGPTIQSLLRRIWEAKGIDDLDSQPISIMTELPSISDDDEMDVVCRAVKTQGMRVVILDPLYLVLLGVGAKTNTANLYEVGPLLKKLCGRLLDAGATPVLVHHFRKQTAGVPDLDDLSGAGIAEFARQWILLGNRSSYDAETGSHSIWMNAGGSAGHGGEWALDVTQKTMDERFQGRVWKVTVLTKQELREQCGVAEDAKNRDRNRSASNDEALLAALRGFPDGETQSQLLVAAGLSNRHGKESLQRLVDDGQVEPCTVVKGAGRRKGRYPGYRLVATERNEELPAAVLSDMEEEATEGDDEDEPDVALGRTF